MKALLRKVGFMTLSIPMFLMGSVTGASAEDGYHEEEKTIIYACQSLTNFDMPVTIKSDVPDTVAPGEEVTFLNSTATVTLPAEAVNTLKYLFVNSISGSVNTFNIHSDNLASTVNVAETPIPIPNTTLPGLGQSVTFTIPDAGGLVVGPFTAGSSGVMTFEAGDIDTTIIPHGGIAPPSFSASCTPKAGEDTTLTVIPIQ